MRASLTRPPNCVNRAACTKAAETAQMPTEIRYDNLFAEMLRRVTAANEALIASGMLPAGIELSRITVEPPRDASHGDMATNAAMVLAKDAGKKPRELAEALAEKLRADPLIEKVEIAGPGFINMTLKAQAWLGALRAAVVAGADYGRSRDRAGREGQCRICLGQSDRADACRPLPGRGVRRRAGEPAGLFRPRRDARILHQRCRRAGRCAGALGISCVTARRWAKTSARFRKGFIRAII